MPDKKQLTEEDKKAKKTLEKRKGKMWVKGKEMEIDITIETTPNASGGYDTKVKLPVNPLGARRN